MRKIIEPQMKIGEEAIANIHIDPRSSDEIPKLLRGLQAIYCNKELRKQVFAALAELVPRLSDVIRPNPAMKMPP